MNLNPSIIFTQKRTKHSPPDSEGRVFLFLTIKVHCISIIFLFFAHKQEQKGRERDKGVCTGMFTINKRRNAQNTLVR